MNEGMKTKTLKCSQTVLIVSLFGKKKINFFDKISTIRYNNSKVKSCLEYSQLCISNKLW